jgi:RNA polymerase sigma-70 factor (ECF subfamily)
MYDTNLMDFLDGLYGYAMALTRNTSDAEDLVQETCLRAIPKLGSLRPDSNLKSWLFTILRNVWLNQLRQKRIAPIADLDADEGIADLIVEPSKNPHASYVSKTEREWVREAIQRLPAASREIILLREYEELSYQEIAHILDCPPGTVMSRLARARSRLRTLLTSPAGVDPIDSTEDTSERAGTADHQDDHFSLR